MAHGIESYIVLIRRQYVLSNVYQITTYCGRFVGVSRTNTVFNGFRKNTSVSIYAPRHC
jgi:hypothetical protein